MEKLSNYIFCNVLKKRYPNLLLDSVGILTKLKKKNCTKKFWTVRTKNECRRSRLTRPTFQRQERLISDALCACHHLIILLFF